MREDTAGSIVTSICCITYNHEGYIAQALDGFLIQETSFPFEIIVGEDCSADRTRHIVLEYQARYPQLIRLVTSETNVGMRQNGKRTRAAARGKYIALCEGDDYWTDPCKLQKQVDFLDSHPDCAVCFHNVTVFYDAAIEPRNLCAPDQKEISTLRDLLQKNFIATCSVVFRSGLARELPPWYYELPVGDWPLHVLNAQHGTIGYLNDVMAVHRVHSEGAWSSLNRLQMLQYDIQFYDRMMSHLGREYHAVIRGRLASRYGELAALYADTGDQALGRQCALRSFTRRRLGQPALDTRFAATVLRLWTPRLYKALRPLARRLLRRVKAVT